jgi:hypothetical protein
MVKGKRTSRQMFRKSVTKTWIKRREEKEEEHRDLRDTWPSTCY